MNKSQRRKYLTALSVGILIIYLLLLAPAQNPSFPKGSYRKPFVWSQDEFWFALEERYKSLRLSGCESINPIIDSSLHSAHQLINKMNARTLNPDDPIFSKIEESIFELGPMIAACPQRLQEYIRLVTSTRSSVKRQSERWDMNAQSTRDRMYRLIFGGRAALEEVMLQAPSTYMPSLVLADDEPSRTPFSRILGATIHSGDILVSRGGAPISALIAQGNDYPGNFSHVAIAYVDEKTSLASIIESSYERGVTISTLEDYLKDIKLRLVVLRVRTNLPEIIVDPMVPHKAALVALEQAKGDHIEYDFEIDHHEHSKMYCSEILSVNYNKFGINLWMGISSISAPGVRSWLASLGVRHFETQEPSDLEYDPQLRVVAEWRDPEALYLDHVDNIVTEVMLDDAEKGEKLSYPWYMLPVGRVIKGYSTIMNYFGSRGPIPEGMSAEAALRIENFVKTHTEIKERVLTLAEEFKRREGYTPTQWNLLKFARLAKSDLQ